MGASLDVLKCALGHTVALLGDMGELGADEAKLHYGVGVHAAENGIQKIVCVGALSKHLAPDPWQKKDRKWYTSRPSRIFWSIWEPLCSPEIPCW